jgi:hypothetical protein
MVQPIHYNNPLSLLIMKYPDHAMITSHMISIDTGNETVDLHLRSSVYHEGYHFTSIIVFNEDDIWYHGSTTESTFVKIEYLSNILDAT